MNSSITPINENDLLAYIENGAAQLTSRSVQNLVAEMPDLREEFAKMRSSAFPEAERKLQFLAAVVESVWTDGYRDMPYRAALEAAFAISYFHRKIDLIPDSLQVIGLTDDAAVVEIVMTRNAAAYEKFAKTTARDWTPLRPDSGQA